MAKYLILIYGAEQQWEAMGDHEWQQINAGHEQFRARAGTAILASGQLEPTTAATTVRAGGGGALAITDGPFLESKEVVGGFYLIDVAHLDEAIALSGLLAEARLHDHSGVQIHPLVDHG
jgi:hypothetical protein